MIQLLRPGYNPPSRFDVAGKLLNNVHQKSSKTCAEILSGLTVCMSLDGWNNVHNEPVICATVTTHNSEMYLVDTINTSGHAHTSEYLVEMALNAITTCEHKFGCHFRSFVIDNAANVAKMRRDLELRENVNVITYGCSAHLLNLLAKDLEIANIKEQIVHVVKYFRNNHFAGAALKSRGGPRLIMPQDMRWNTMADCLESYIKSWSIMMTICEENRHEIDNNISCVVNNPGIKRNAEELLQRLKPTAVALDSVQKDSCSIADAVEIWKKLEADLALDNRDAKKKIKKRVGLALTPSHFLANIVHPRYRGRSLTNSEYETAMQHASTQYSDIIPVSKLKQLHFKHLCFKKMLFGQLTR